MSEAKLPKPEPTSGEPSAKDVPEDSPLRGYQGKGKGGYGAARATGKTKTWTGR